MITKSLTYQMRHGNRVLQRIVSAQAEGHDAFKIACVTTNQEVPIAIDVSALKMLYMVCDQDVAIAWNDTVGSQDTIYLKAGIPLVWENQSGYYDNPLGTTDVTVFFVSIDITAGTLFIDFLQDVTP